MTQKNQTSTRNANSITQRSAADRILIGGTLLFLMAAIVDNQLVFNFSILFGIAYLIRMNE